MLTDDDLRLITAAVDGELTPAQEPAFRGLLAASDEAVAAYRQLRAQSARLARLRKVPAPKGLAEAVSARLRPAQPTLRRQPLARRAGAWLPYAVAASVLVSAGAGAFWFSTRPNRPDSPAVELARRESLPRPTKDGNGREVTPAVAQAVERLMPEPPTVPRATTPAVVAVTPKPRTPEPVPAPRPAVPDLWASAVLPDLKPFEGVQVRLPLLRPLAELDAADAQAQLATDLARDPAFRLDIVVRDAARGTELLHTAARAAGVTVVTEPLAAERLKRKVPSAWAVYTESLAAEDIAKLAAELAAQDRTADLRGTAHLFPLNPARLSDSRDVRDLLGIDPGSWKRPKPAAPAPTPGKSVAAGTVDQVTATLKGKPPEKPALLLTYSPHAARVNPAASKEVREFFARRDDRKPGVVPLLIVVRPAS